HQDEANPVPGADHQGGARRHQHEHRDLEDVHDRGGRHRGPFFPRQSPSARTRIALIVACDRNGATATMMTSASTVSPLFSSRPSVTRTASATSTGAPPAAGVT